MIVLLSYSTSWCQNSSTLPTGGLEQNDSLVLVPVSALRIANAKMIELKYEREINQNLHRIISNDSLAFISYNKSILEHKEQVNKVKKERNIAAGGGLVALILLVISIIK